jgi:hypothetical protein
VVDVGAIDRNLVLGSGMMVGIGGLIAGVVFGFIAVHVANSFGNMVTLVTYRQLRKVPPPSSEARARVSAPC